MAGKKGVAFLRGNAKAKRHPFRAMAKNNSTHSMANNSWLERIVFYL